MHRDLKPANIFLVRDPEVVGGERAKILDFGIAKLIGDASVNTSNSVVLGTPPYMSPEQCRGGGQVDQRSDVYALGCVMFTALTGQPPFDARGAGDIIAMHLRELAPAPSSVAAGIPPEIDQLVLRCLAKDPAERFASGGELAAAIDLVREMTPGVDAMGPAVHRGGASFVTSPTTLSMVASRSGRSMSPAAHRSRQGLAGGRRIAAMAMIGIGMAGIALPGTHGASPTPTATDAVQALSATPARPAEPGAPDPVPSAPDPEPDAPDPEPSAPDSKPGASDPRSVLADPRKDVASANVAPRPKRIGRGVSASRQSARKTPDVSGPAHEAPSTVDNPTAGSAAPLKSPLILDGDGIPVQR